MLLYEVRWYLCSDLTKGKGRAKNNEDFCAFLVLCRNSKDALSCLDYHFHNVFLHSDKFTLEDGEVFLKRCVVDSRGFHAHYLLMDGIKEPIILSDLKSNKLRLNSIFR